MDQRRSVTSAGPAPARELLAPRAARPASSPLAARRRVPQQRTVDSSPPERPATDRISLAEIVEASPAEEGLTVRTARQGLAAVLGMAAMAAFLGAIGSLVLYWVGIRLLGYLG